MPILGVYTPAPTSATALILPRSPSPPSPIFQSYHPRRLTWSATALQAPGLNSHYRTRGRGQPARSRGTSYAPKTGSAVRMGMPST